jgi:spore coat protein U-like protein
MQIKQGKKMNSLKVLGVALATLTTSHAFAEPSGGALAVDESVASFDVQAEVANVLSITGMTDIDFGTISPGVGVGGEPAADASQSMSFCVYSNGPFSISMSSSSGLDSFNMYAPSVGERLDYSIKLESGDSLLGGPFGYTTVAESMLYGVDYGSFSYDTFSYVDQNCNSSDGQRNNFRATFSIDSDDLNYATPAYYSDTLQITARFSAPPPV